MTLANLIERLNYLAQRIGGEWPVEVVDGDGNELELSIHCEVVDDAQNDTGTGCRVRLEAK